MSHIVPLAGVVHWGGRRVPRPMAKCDARWRDREVSSNRMWTARASCSPAESQGTQRPRSSGAACSACSPGRLAFAVEACVVQGPPPTGRGGPRRRADRLASDVGGRFNARPLSRGAALVRGPVCRAARGRLPLTRSGNLPRAV